MATSYIGADVHSKTTELAVERRQRIVGRFSVPTALPALREVLGTIPGPKEMVIEEGPMAHWLYRNLRGVVDRLVVCDPRRNKLIAYDGDADDAIDARKLAILLRGGYLRTVHHSDDDKQVLLKQWVGLYHDRVRQAVREVNKIRARCRMHGLRPARGALRNPSRRETWLASLGRSPAVTQLQMLFVGYDAAVEQVRLARREVGRWSRPHTILRYWRALPGVGPIRAVTLLAYLDTPWRFHSNPRKLWKYCGVGLMHSSSGKDKNGLPKKGLLQLAWAVNRRLKDAVMGSAISAIRQGDNVFADYYERLVHKGLTPSNARHTVARKMLTVMWGMWKTNRPFDEQLVCSVDGAAEEPGSRTRCNR